MTSNKEKSFAHIQVRLEGRSRDEAIVEIARMDGIDMKAATLAYNDAMRQMSAKILSAQTKKEIKEMARADAKECFDSGCFDATFNNAAAKRYLTYRKEFWKTLETLEK